MRKTAATFCITILFLTGVTGRVAFGGALIQPPKKPAVQSSILPGEKIPGGYHGCRDHEEHAYFDQPDPQDGSRDLVARDLVPARPEPSLSNENLILYDEDSGAYGKLGITYAIMLRNLLGHFSMSGDMVRVQDYSAGQVERYKTVFYLGELYDHALPDSFLKDVSKTSKRVVWFKYNLWKYAWDPAYSFQSKYGFSFKDVRGFSSAPSASHPSPDFYDTVLYKGKSFVKFYEYHASSSTISSDPEIGFTQITDPAKAVQVVAIQNSKTRETAPYIIRSGNFWYIADTPFSYIGPRDRYLVFCDILHDILGINHPEIHRAMIRLEDVSATVDVPAMKKLSDFLSGRKIEFSIATIPHYKDPLGHFNGGTPLDIPFSAAANLLTSLKYAMAHGGALVMHGFTHQYDSMTNPNTGVSADDYEFWNAVQNSPVAEDSETWVTGRLRAAISEMASRQLAPFAWEPPHYQASPLDYRVFARTFATTYQRAVYYSSEKPDLDPSHAGHDYTAGMFYPYITDADYYGQRVLPENLGNIEYDISDIDPSSGVVYTAADILKNADYALAVRDGYASFFFHPFWIEDDMAYLNAWPAFTGMVDGITKLGYRWVGAASLSGSSAGWPDQ